MKIFTVQVPIFGVDIAVCTGCTGAEAREAFYDLGGLRTIVPVPDSGRGACCIEDGTSEIYLWVGSPEDYASTVFHELVHTAFGICDLRGMQRDDELIAYLMGWLKKEIADKIFFEAAPE